MKRTIVRTGCHLAAVLLFSSCAHVGIDAASQGDVEALNAWLTEGGTINSPGGSNDWTALHAAAANGQTEALKFLLSRGADPNVVDWEGNTPLCVVLSREQSPREAEVVWILAEGGADVNKTCSNGSPLHWASLRYKWDAAVPLLEKGAVTQRRYSKAEEPLCKAALSARADVVRLMLNNGTDPNLHDGAAMFDALNTPQRDSYEVIKLLVENGANLKVVQEGDGTGDAPLHRVVLLRTYGSSRLVDIMVNHGADPYAVNRNRQLPLDTALGKSKTIAHRMIKHMALELPNSDPAKMAYDKIVMAAAPGRILETVERMLATAGYLRAQSKMLRAGEYAKSSKSAQGRARRERVDEEVAELSDGLVTYATALVGTLANSAVAGELDLKKTQDAFFSLMSTVSADMANANSARVKKGVAQSTAAARIQAVVGMCKQLEENVSGR